MDLTAYEELALQCEDLLAQNKEWISRYGGYIKKLNDARSTILESQTRFFLPDPLKLYLPLSSAIKGGSGRITYDLRYRGQSAGSLTVDTKKAKAAKEDVFLQINERSRFLGSSHCQYRPYAAASEKQLNWHTDDGAAAFRKTFRDADFRREDFDNPEHRLESYLLSNYAKRSSNGKELLRIQPVGMCGTAAKFQMPTPFKASTLHDPRVKVDQKLYAGQYGGGIDILARTGIGRATYLTVIELKDENRVSESPQDAIRQAIAYSVFVRELLRCEEAGNSDWWHFFGFSGEIPQKLVLRAVIAMPFEGSGNAAQAEENARQFMQDTDALHPKILLGNDVIELHYVFRDVAANTSFTSLK